MKFKICFHNKKLVDFGYFNDDMELGYNIYCCSKCGKFWGLKHKDKQKEKAKKDREAYKKATQFYKDIKK